MSLHAVDITTILQFFILFIFIIIIMTYVDFTYLQYKMVDYCSQNIVSNVISSKLDKSAVSMFIYIFSRMCSAEKRFGRISLSTKEAQMQ